MKAQFHPIPRISEHPSGKIFRKDVSMPWSLPPKGEGAVPMKQVQCFVCRQMCNVPKSAISAKCLHCASYIKMDDISLHARTHRTFVRTWGTVTIRANADLKGLDVECLHLVMHGRGSGKFRCQGLCKIKSDQHISGMIEAQRLVIEKKAKVTVVGGMLVKDCQINGVLEGQIKASNVITIRRNAKFLGDIVARQLVIEEGGIHQGAFTKLSD